MPTQPEPTDSSSTEKPHGPIRWSNYTDGDSLIFPNNGQPIIISPVLTQNIGPISAESGGFPPHSNNNGNSVFQSPAHLDTNQDDRSEIDKEKIRNLKSLLRTAEADKKQMRLEFDRERERYEKSLDSKDKAMEKQLNMKQGWI